MPLRLLGLLCLCLGLVALGGCSSAESTAQDQTAPPEKVGVNVRVHTVAPTALRDAITLPGQTEPIADVRVAAERAGMVEWRGVRRGESVQSGQPIARIDAVALGAALERAKANLRLAQAKETRRRELFEANVLSREELDGAATELTLARANVREAESDYAKGVVEAPLSGVVDEVYVDPGEYINAGDPVADLVDSSTIRIIVNAPELDVRYLRPGDKAAVRIDAWPDRTWDGAVDFVATKADEATRTFRVRVVVDNADGAIRPGMMARVTLTRRIIDNAITVPLAVIQDKNGERVVFVEDGGMARARTVTTGVVNGTSIQILDGLSEGERLIVSGHAQVEEGTRVNVQ